MSKPPPQTRGRPVDAPTAAERTRSLHRTHAFKSAFNQYALFTGLLFLPSVSSLQQFLSNTPSLSYSTCPLEALRVSGLDLLPALTSQLHFPFGANVGDCMLKLTEMVLRHVACAGGNLEPGRLNLRALGWKLCPRAVLHAQRLSVCWRLHHVMFPH